MKGCARTCLLGLLFFLAASGAFYMYLRGFGEMEPQIWWASGGAGLCVSLAIGYALGIATISKERAMLLGAMVGHPPQDGNWVAVSGTIRSLNPLRTPITGIAAIAYSYEMYRMERSGKSTSKVTYYEGKALTPSTIASKQGAIRLLAVPTLDVPPENTQNAMAIANAKQYVDATTFEKSNTQPFGTDKEAADDDGMYRVDKKNSDREIDVAECMLEERHIKQGEIVCAFGLYSSHRGGLIPHPNWSKPARIMRGDANAVADQLRTRMIKYSFGIVFFSAAAFGIVMLYQRAASALV
jgi:hypothetical protein